MVILVPLIPGFFAVQVAGHPFIPVAAVHLDSVRAGGTERVRDDALEEREEALQNRRERRVRLPVVDGMEVVDVPERPYAAGGGHLEVCGQPLVLF